MLPEFMSYSSRVHFIPPEHHTLVHIGTLPSPPEPALYTANTLIDTQNETFNVIPESVYNEHYTDSPTNRDLYFILFIQ